MYRAFARNDNNTVLRCEVKYAKQRQFKFANLVCAKIELSIQYDLLVRVVSK